MSSSRRDFLLGATAVLLSGCRDRPVPSNPSNSLADQIEAALAKAVSFLASQQSADGVWRSDLVGTFKDGTALTPLVLLALLHADPESTSIRKSASWLAAMAKPDGIVVSPEEYGFDYPVYTAALTVGALSHPACPEHLSARDTWLKYLKDRQLTEALGWSLVDREYGGWGYCHGLPRKPKAGALIPPLTESNISATTFALSALNVAKVKVDDPAFSRAFIFVKSCQNWNDDEKQRDPKFDDGGFYFIYEDPVRNKAGVSGKDKFGRTRFNSYPSMTADGLRCLSMCGLANDHPRLLAARKWLDDHIAGSLGDQPFNRAVFFYAAMSLAQATSAFRAWLVGELLKLQRQDGSWANQADDFREHEPLVATSFACLALAHSRPYQTN